MTENASARLRPHQRDAVAAALSALTTLPRATLVSACGTGKTWMAAATARSVAAGGRVLTLVPTLDLLAQTITAWDAFGHSAAIAVCSDEELTRTRRGARARTVTTSPAQLAALARGGATVYATYASLPVIAAAHRDHQLPAWDLAVIDEAHRTSGKVGRPWAAVHQDTVIPAARRLYMTATPRILDEDGAVVASMHDEAVYGPTVYRLGFGEAITAGILADYRIAVAAVADADARALIQSAAVLAAHDGPAVPADALALAVALLRTSRELGLERIVSYHSRVARARQFARAVTAAQRVLPESERPADVWARATWGKLPAQARRELLHAFASDGADVRLLANARLLGEGIDAPAIDAVVFGDAKYSVIDTVQAVGRALRPGSAPGKVATIVVPVFVGPGENPDSALDGSAWAPLWKTLRALHAHDDRVIARARAAGSGGAGRGSRPDLSWLHVSGLPVPDDFPLALNLRLLDRKSAEWRRGFAAARRHHAAHGDLAVAQSHVDDRGFALGSWLAWQRYLYNSGSLPDARRDALEALGVVWNPRASAWERGYEAARRCADDFGHLAVPRPFVYAGFDVGTWLENQRHRRGSEERMALLAKLDPWWNPPWDLLWQRRYYELRSFHGEHGHADVPRTEKSEQGRMLGEWVHRQRRDRGLLHPEQVALLDALGFDWLALSRHERAWQAGVAALVRFRGEHGHLRVPQSYVDTEGFKVGVWVNNTRRRAAALSAERSAELDALGFEWGSAARFSG